MNSGHRRYNPTSLKPSMTHFCYQKSVANVEKHELLIGRCESRKKYRFLFHSRYSDFS